MSPPWSSAMVTGASSGIGEAIVRQLAGAGVPTVVVARRAERLQALATELAGIEVLPADLGDRAARARVAERLADPARPIDLLVNNAGFGTSGPFVELDVERALAEVELNVNALVHLARAGAAAMAVRGRGWILNVSSVAGFQAAPALAHYGATKAFVTALSESMHEELSDHGVRVTALCPGLTRTEFQSISRTAPGVAAYPAFLWTTPEQVARRGLRDVARGRTLSIPGLQYKILVAASNAVPRALSRRVAGLVRTHPR